MIKILLGCFLLLAILCCNDKSKSNNISNIQFHQSVDTLSQRDVNLDSLILKIVRNSDLRKENNGFICSQIVSEVYSCLFEDSLELKEEDKFDLLHILIYYQGSATDEYRSIIRDQIKDKNNNIVSYPQFTLPIALCHHCDYLIIDNLEIDTIKREITKKYPKFYRKYYLQYLEILLNLKKKHPHKADDYRYKLVNFEIINSLEFKKKYGNLLKEIEQ